LWAVVSLGCGILWVVVSLLLGGNAVGVGATACNYGLLATVGLLHRGRRFLILFVAVEAQHLVVGLIVVGILLNLGNPMRLVWIAGAPVAYLYVNAKWRYAAARPRRSTI